VIAAFDKKAVFSRLLKTKIKKTSVSNELLGKMEVEFADNPSTPSTRELAYLEKLLSNLEDKAGKKTILLLIDEVQHLSTSSHFSPLAHTLRTILDKRQGRVKSIFTGSSRHYMNILFNKSQSPFYHFVEAVPFPDLDEKFISFLREKLSSNHQIEVPIRPLLRAFSQMDQSPYWMMKLISHMITSKVSIGEAQEYVLQLMEATEDFGSVANKIKPIDRIVFLALCEGMNPFSRELMAKISHETNVKGVQSNIQRAIQRLSEANLISQIHKGEYNIEKPGMKRYLERLK
jgi:predicted transcriptional regulator